MTKTKETFWNDYDRVSNQIKNLQIEDNKYEMLLRTQDNLRNEIVKLEQMESENKREILRTIRDGVTFVGSLAFGIWTVVKTFKFDENSSVTSTLGRSVLNNAIPKILKR